MGERESQGEPGSIAQSTQEAERPQARYRPRPRGRARAGDLRVVVAHVLPALPQRDRHVRGGRAAAARAGLLVRPELAHHIQPGRSYSATLRNPEAQGPEGRTQQHDGKHFSTSTRYALRVSLVGTPLQAACQPGLAQAKADTLTSGGVSRSVLKC